MIDIFILLFFLFFYFLVLFVCVYVELCISLFYCDFLFLILFVCKAYFAKYRAMYFFGLLIIYFSVFYFCFPFRACMCVCVSWQLHAYGGEPERGLQDDGSLGGGELPVGQDPCDPRLGAVGDSAPAQAGQHGQVDRVCTTVCSSLLRRIFG